MSCFAPVWGICHFEGTAVAEWLSSWLVEQEDRGSIPRLATWIFRDWLSPASKSRYGWKIAKSTLILKTTNQPTNLPFWKIKQFGFFSIANIYICTLFYFKIEKNKKERQGNKKNDLILRKTIHVGLELTTPASTGQSVNHCATKDLKLSVYLSYI